MDGAWTGHPDQNEIAVQQFPIPNQIDVRKLDAPTQPDLRPAPKGIGTISMNGTRAAIRTIIRYRNGVLNGKGASLLDSYMEDLATDRIYRLMIAQRMRHRDRLGVLSDYHTPESIGKIFNQELDTILSELPPDAGDAVIEKYRAARSISESLIRNGAFDPI
jgi:malate synthase